VDKPASLPVEIQPDFPYGAPIKGKVYAMDHTYQIGPLEGGDRHTVRIIVMSEESWGDFGTMLQSLREVAKNQDKRIKELLAEAGGRERVLADTMQRLDNLRAVRRAEKRPEVEADMNLPAT